MILNPISKCKCKLTKQSEGLVSIIILNYNAGQLLLDCIESISNTEYDNYEIILVDNASTDKSLQKMQREI